MRKKKKNNITIIDIAKKANVSISTISRVINKPYLVSKAKRDLIKAIIKKEKFVISNVAQSFSSKHSKNVFYIIGDEARNTLYFRFLKTITLVLTNYKFIVSILFVESDFLNKKMLDVVLGKKPCFIFSFNEKIKNMFDKIKTNKHFEFVFWKEKYFTLINLSKLVIKLSKNIKSHEGVKNEN